MKDRIKVQILGKDFLIPLGDVECHRVIGDQVHDLGHAMEYVKNTHVVVQAGGNFGLWAHALCGLFDHVYTYEPHPENFFCLVRNCPEENIYKFQAGLSDEPAVMSMEGEARNAGAYQMGGPGYLPTVRLDDFAFPAMDLLCLDIEGMELKALMGARKHLEKFSPVIMLEDKGLSEKYGTKKGEVTTWLQQLGYNLKEEIHRDLIFTKG